MRVTRTNAIELINRLVTGSGQGAVDLGSLVDDPRCYALVGDPPLGTHICLQVVEGVYEVHSAVLPEGRGEWTIEFTEAAIREMFTATDCIELITRLPQGVVAASALARRFGFSLRWIGDEMMYQGHVVPYSVWSLTLMEWIPAEEFGFQAVLAEMRSKGQKQKADVWHARRSFVSRKVDA